MLAWETPLIRNLSGASKSCPVIPGYRWCQAGVTIMAEPVKEPRPGLVRELGSHPRGVVILSATELAERFSYYGMTALLVLYMVHQLLRPEHASHVIGLAALRRLFEWRGPLADQAFASLVYGWYAGLVYFTPLIGGWVADRWLGARRTVVAGALMMAAGHLAMSFDQTFLIALLLLIAGSGCLKGNISAQLAPLYAPEDKSRRARGFTIFSTGINVGATAGPLATGWLAQAYGWHAGFACAAVVMACSLAIYLSGQRYLKGKAGEDGETSRTVAPAMAGDGKRVAALLLLIAVNVPIAAGYYQISNVGLIWVESSVNLVTPLGRIPTSWFNALDSFASILVAAPLIALWSRQARRGSEPDGLSKVLIGAIINAGAPLLLVAAIALTAPGEKVSAWWPLLSWFLFGLAFMFYWPLTLGLVAARAPDRLRSTLMGASFLALFMGNVLLGWVGSFYEQLGPTAFWVLDSAIGGVAVVVLLIALRPMRRILLP